MIIPFLIFLILFYYIFNYFYENKKTSNNLNNNNENNNNNTALNLSTEAKLIQNILKISNNKRRITITIEDVLLKGNNKLLKENYIKKDIEYLSYLLELAQVYLIVKANTDEEQELYTQEILNQLSILKSPLQIPKHRILFYSTDIGKKAIIRQINPHVHFDGDSSLCESMAQFITFMVHVNHSFDQNPTLGFPSSITNPRVYPWYILNSISRLTEIEPLIVKPKNK